MSPITVGIIGTCILLIAFFLGMPVAFAMILIGLAGMLWLVPLEAALGFVSMDLYGMFSSYTFSLIPMFVLMGYWAAMTGMTKRLFDVSFTWVGSLPGGLTAASVLACGAFSAVCGSGAATAATVGKVAYPEMKRFNYDSGFSTGCIAAAGTLGPMIPPSTGMIIYAILAEQSIAKCLISGIIPGLIIIALLVMTAVIMCRRNPSLGPPGLPTSWTDKLRALPGLTEAGGLFLFCIGGMFAGVFTPSQAGAAGCIGALLIGLIRRNLSWQKLWSASKETLRVSCMILFLVTSAVVFGHFLSLSTVSLSIVEWAGQLSVSRWVIFAILCMFYLIGGCIMDALGLKVLTIPIVVPVILALGFDPIWYGVILCLLSEIGAITPPVGVCVYVLKGIAPEVPLEKIFAGTAPFLIALFVALFIMTAFPILSTFLPSLVVK